MIYFAMLPSPTVSSCFHIHVCKINLIAKPFCEPSFLAEIAESVLLMRCEDHAQIQKRFCQRGSKFAKLTVFLVDEGI